MTRNAAKLDTDRGRRISAAMLSTGVLRRSSHEESCRLQAATKLVRYERHHHEELIFLAGVFAGEGFIGNNFSNVRKCDGTSPLCLDIGMNDFATIKRFAAMIRMLKPGGGDTCIQYRQQKFTRLARVSCSGTSAESVMRAMYPYLAATQKGEQARVAFDRAGVPDL